MNDAQAVDRLRHLALSSGQSMRTVADWLLAELPTAQPSADAGGEQREDP